MGPPEGDHVPGEVQQLLVEPFGPVEPADLVVLAVGVVVAALAAAHLIAPEDHRHALAEQHRRQHVLLLSQTQGQDVGIVGRALSPVVVGPVVIRPVVALFTVGLVVLLVVADEVGQGEPVVGGHEVDARHRTAGVGLVQVARSCEALRELAQRGRLAAPEVPDGVAVLAVPLRPDGREVAHLVAALADVPGLRDQLDLADDRVLLDDVEEG